MNVLMLNPPFHPRFSRSQRSPAVIKSGVMYYPIWSAYATGVLELDGFRVKLVDAPAAGLSREAVLDLAEAFAPRLVVLDTSTPSIHNDVAVAEALKQRLPGCAIALVGPHVSVLPEESLRMSPAVSLVARHEYDYTLRDVARALDGGSDLVEVAGISYRTAAGEIVHNPDRPFIKDLDALPFVSEVYKRHLRVEDYFYSITRYPEVAIIAGRGCPYQCTYCLWPQSLTGRGYRRRSPANVADEFEYIAHELPQVKEVFIEDDTMTVNADYARRLAEALAQRKVRLPFSANSRADATYDTLYSLKQAGLRLVCVGFESGDQTVLDGIQKNISVQQFRDFRSAAKRAGVLVHGCFMAGNPGETRQSLHKTLDLACQLDPDTAQFFPLMVYPGTRAYDQARAEGHLLSDDYRAWLTDDGLHRSVVSYPHLTADELAAWCDSARRTFYLRPRYLLRKAWEMLAHPGEARRILRASRSFARYLARPARAPRAEAATVEGEP